MTQAQPPSELLALQRMVARKGAPEEPRELRATFSGPPPIQLADDKKPAEKPAVDQKADLAARLEAASQNEKLTSTEAYALLEEYNKLNGKDHVIEGVADINSYRGEKGKIVGYAGRGGIDVDGPQNQIQQFSEVMTNENTASHKGGRLRQGKQ